ncbi:uncharacterized protein BDZ99DRAFT_210925 [Mytilinidion resinicola]|uniref:Uncharacterized protein n=1 Tax=Mytilinidion resinicola TaxID=574789 RepID=A0A6A6Y335_9PEZI|nr:uncharacterized protein BDZ99DRAFT_210925 [Mytilinidion resinicola]KAF2802197.1 hypothetical protein BDZ99DRAFT_210925 [Mytilinidion resinicola]
MDALRQLLRMVEEIMEGDPRDRGYNRLAQQLQPGRPLYSVNSVTYELAGTLPESQAGVVAAAFLREAKTPFAHYGWGLDCWMPAYKSYLAEYLRDVRPIYGALFEEHRQKELASATRKAEGAKQKRELAKEAKEAKEKKRKREKERREAGATRLKRLKRDS